MICNIDIREFQSKFPENQIVVSVRYLSIVIVLLFIQLFSILHTSV